MAVVILKKTKFILLLFVQLFICSIVAVGILSSTDLGGNVSSNRLIDRSKLSASASPTLVWSYDTSETVYHVAISADGSTVASSGVYNLTVLNQNGLIWETTRASTIRSVAISADGTYIFTGDGNCNATLFNKTDGYMWHYRGDSANEMRDVDISADGFYMVTCEAQVECNVTLFNRTDKRMWHYDTGTNLYSVAISGDGMYMVSGDENNNLTVFNRTHGFMWNYTFNYQVGKVAISKNGQYLLAGTTNGDLTLFETANGPVYTWSINLGSNIDCLDISADGQYLAAGVGGGEVFLYKRDQTKLWEYDVGNVLTVAISQDGNYVVSGDMSNLTLFNRNGYVWNYTAAARFAEVVISADGKYIAGANWDSNVYLFLNPIPSDNFLQLIIFLDMLQSGADGQQVIILGVLIGIFGGIGILIAFLILKQKQ